MIVNVCISSRDDSSVMSIFETKGVSFERLHTFQKIVLAGGITAAAGDDPNRQSQYSRQLKELESFFGQELARRGHGKFQVTQAGAELYRIVNLHFQALRDFKIRGSSEKHLISIGAGEVVLKWLVLPNLCAMREEFSKIEWVFENRTTEEAFRQVVSGRLDIAIANEIPAIRGLDSCPIGATEVIALAPTKITFTNTRSFVQDIARYPLVVLEGSSTFLSLKDEARRLDIGLNVAARCTSYGQVFEGLKALGGAGFLPRLASVEGWPTQLHVSTLPQGWGERKLHLVWSSNAATLRPVIQIIVDKLSERFSRFLQRTSSS